MFCSQYLVAHMLCYVTNNRGAANVINLSFAKNGILAIEELNHLSGNNTQRSFRSFARCLLHCSPAALVHNQIGYRDTLHELILSGNPLSVGLDDRIYAHEVTSRFPSLQLLDAAPPRVSINHYFTSTMSMSSVRCD
jgi:hypothetical protein